MEVFIVGRYEAGIPEIADFYPNAEDSYKYIQEGRDTGDIAPISKKNTASWSWISQENAKNAAEKMVTGKSHLIDGTAWDTIVEWIGEEGKTVTDSKDVGNYMDKDIIPIGTMYINHTYSSKWTTGDRYQQAIEDMKHLSISGQNNYEIYTGSMKDTKLKNIYDMGGNMWEWTTEIGRHSSVNSYAVLRGGCFTVAGSQKPLCVRYGRYSTDTTDIVTGFRVVLYL